MAARAGGANWTEALAGMVGRSYRLQLPLERPALEAALRLGRPRKHERVLDVATGTAELLASLARRPERPSHAVGVDVAPGMLAAAGSLPAGYELKAGDARALPFADAGFDLVFAVYLLHLLEPDDRLCVVGEMARVLRPGGRAVTVTVWDPRPGKRRVLARMPRRAGLIPHDPTADLESADLAVAQRCLVRRGYPSLVLAAVRPEGDRAPASRQATAG